MRTTSIILILLFAFTLAACGGGGGSSRVPEPVVVTHTVDLGELMLAEGEAGPHEIAAGESEEIRGINFTCPAGGNDCTLMIAADDTATSTGALVTAMAVPPPTVHAITLPDAPMVPPGVPYEVPETTLDEAVTIEAGDMHTEGYVTFSCPAGGDACTVAQAEDGSFTSTGGMATVMVANSVTTGLQAAIDAAAAAAKVAATKAAGTKRTAILAESMQEAADDAGLGGTARTDVGETTTEVTDDVYGLAIERDRDGTTVKITDPAAAGDEDPKFTQAMDLGSGRTMHTRAMEADDDGNVVEEVVIVSTDIEGPKGVAFAMWQAGPVPADPAPQALTVNGNTGELADVTNGETNNALTIPADADTTGDANTNLMFARSTTSGTLNYTFNDTTTAGTDEAVHDGTYNGAEGTYRCTGTAACTVTFNDKGMVTGNSAGWVFIPDRGATSDQPDYDYLHYGVWLKKTTDEDGAVTYNEVETFAGSSLDPSTGSGLDTVEGSASYEGDATVVYVHEVSNPDGTEASATSGHFTADVSLTAYFAQTGDNPETGDFEAGTVAPNLLNTVSGSINNFMLSGGEANTWSATVQASRAGGENTFSGTAKGGNGDGSILGTFYGPTPLTPADNDPATATTAPGSMAGEFNAGFSNGSVAGAFGARKNDE